MHRRATQATSLSWSNPTIASYVEGEELDSEVDDVDDGRSVLLEEADGGELVGLELPRWGDDEGKGRMKWGSYYID
ncbi:Aa_trans domain-containing protein [Psidium guajava]|nr:Aa_trans domain-containing protein [Psidium guajava]